MVIMKIWELSMESLWGSDQRKVPEEPEDRNGLYVCIDILCFSMLMIKGSHNPFECKEGKYIS